MRQSKPESKCTSSSLIVSTTCIILLPESCWPHFIYLEVVGRRHLAYFLLDAEVIFLKSNLESHTLNVNFRGETSFFLQE